MKTKDKIKSNDTRINQKDWKNVLDLYHACLDNAADIINEADMLYKNKCYSRSFALAIIAYEEIGKSQIVADLFNDMASKKEFEEAFRKHEIKSSYNSRRFIIETKLKVKSHIDYDKSKGKEYTKWRLAATYVDFSKDYSAQIPKNVITKDAAKNSIDVAKKEIDDIYKYSYLTERIGSKSFTK